MTDTLWWHVILQTPWDEVRNEMINEKGLSSESADLIGQYVCLHGTLFCMYGRVLFRFGNSISHVCMYACVHMLWFD